MRKVALYSVLLVVGLGLSQFLPQWLGGAFETSVSMIRVLTMTGLAFIMIHVGFEFHLDKKRLGQYGWDYVVAFTAASFPWILVTGYFILVMLPPGSWSSFAAWQETLLAGRFAAPTSAGVLFSMLAAADLGTTWLFRKARILAIFDDLDTVLLMIPLKILIVGIAWQLGLIAVAMAAMLLAAYVWLHRIRIPVTWPWVLTYSVAIVGLSELLYKTSKLIDPSVPIHIEVLLPAFVVGCVALPAATKRQLTAKTVQQQLHDILDRPEEKQAMMVIAALFMVLVGLSMPALHGNADAQHLAPPPELLYGAAPASVVHEPFLQDRYQPQAAAAVTASQPSLSWGVIAIHVLLITLLSNLGKMFPAFCYRREAHWRHRLALAVGMWPRGEVGAGILVLSLSYGIGGPVLTVAMLSLALNLVLTGVFILLVKKLIAGIPEQPGASTKVY